MKLLHKKEYDMINIFKSDEAYIVSLIPQTDEEKNMLSSIQKLVAKQDELKEQEQIVKDISADNTAAKKDDAYEQMLLELY